MCVWGVCGGGGVGGGSCLAIVWDSVSTLG